MTKTSRCRRCWCSPRVLTLSSFLAQIPPDQILSGRSAGLTPSQVLKRSCLGNHSVTKRFLVVMGTLTLGSLVVSCSSIEGGPEETSTEGIFVRESALGTRTTGRPLGDTNSNVPSQETSSVEKECVSDSEVIGVYRDVAGRTSGGHTS